MFDRLAAEFPRSAVSWRAQTVTKDGTKALALAYIDARDVMDRLDEVCGPENWSDRYEFHGSRTVCYLSLRINGEWIVKADGAGDSDVEAEKGAISDALKRAAVKWGIGRYLYHIEAPWVPCECSEYNGKKQWKGWKSDPWKFVRNLPAEPDYREKNSEAIESLWAELSHLRSERALASFWKDNVKTITGMDAETRQRFIDKKDELKAKFADDTLSSIEDTFPGSTVVNDRVTDAEARRHPMNA
jgi:hypothetical protein